MKWLNYHHLLYFWKTAKIGSLTKAAAELHLAQPTLSSQIKTLESNFGAKLFDRSGRTLALTETGQIVFRYAEEIFSLGEELTEAVQGRTPEERLKLSVGVPDALPKLVVYQLLKPALDLNEKVQFVCIEGKFQELLGELALHRLDLILADSPVPPQTHIRAFNHLLGECGVSVLGTEELYDEFHERFPQSLDGAPVLLPTQNTVLRRTLEQWFEANCIRPFIKHEFEDSGVLKVFGQSGEGLFVVPTAIEEEVCRQYSVRSLGRISEIKERFYAITVERRLKHSAVIAISNSARNSLFQQKAP
ncbi:transcriptional activator NhaR [Bremerella alba]|uniref:Transcriptional activator protein NhaR n=1 Tax=Bremerella alba TaxID=980252 RepID=A0A7V8V2B4_9BACT|nr:transcriptional activator NhaR [Bremerella alba]MBA2113596.1 Transcriptional activator protein NhaR [Bremerella alba]